MAQYLVNPELAKSFPHFETLYALNVSEIFYDTIQGEGVYAGVPAIFLRLAGCPVNCIWCDSKNIWKHAITMDILYLIDLFKKNGLIERLNKGHHLVITGGSPLLQQDMLLLFITNLVHECKGKPFIEIENECSMEVKNENTLLFYYIDCWNNSPKLENAKSKFAGRYNPAALKQVGIEASECWFKFVVDPNNPEKTWKEIQSEYLDMGLIKRSQIILMPLGASREELTPEKRASIAEFGVSKGVRYSERVQINLYDKKQGV